jgi:hypothetical protein
MSASIINDNSIQHRPWAAFTLRTALRQGRSVNESKLPSVPNVKAVNG